jgi:hypothetical protein
MLRRIFDPVLENGFWFVRYKTELYELFSVPDIVKTIKKLEEYDGQVMLSEC